MSNNNYQVFNKFQQNFYTSISEFDKYTDYEIRINSYMLMNNMIKGNPAIALTLMNCYSDHVKMIQSPAIIKALQRKFINGFSKAKMPQYIYFKDQSKASKTTKNKSSSNDKIIEVEPLIKQNICSILFIDNKTFDYLLFRKNPKILSLIKEYTKND